MCTADELFTHLFRPSLIYLFIYFDLFIEQNSSMNKFYSATNAGEYYMTPSCEFGLQLAAPSDPRTNIFNPRKQLYYFF